jgi:2-amino-4-hydroxy-6-hydroxymethyldihydropteridine diphosphokinase
MEPQNDYVLLLGSNLGDQSANLDEALRQISGRVGTVMLRSSRYCTEPLGLKGAYFLNQVVAGHTRLDAADLMNILLTIEQEMGRIRTGKMQSRIIDLDILFYNQDVINQPGLIVPHPRLHERRFTLEPLSEILPDLIHPQIGKSVKQLLTALKDDLEVKKC